MIRGICKTTFLTFLEAAISTALLLSATTHSARNSGVRAQHERRKTSVTLDYLPGPLGNYYYPTNGGNLSRLLNKGTGSAASLGLYHYTVSTKEVPEGNSVVSIGFHYVALDNNTGNPLDTNGDGVPDYLEDSNGNGLIDSGEIGWNIVGDLGLKVIISRPQSGTLIP